ncbi:DUF1667 domain-containing protein [Vallitalea okinawensis]|uniref:DUF1667 domain-containing protein n=1 Tax=Vallitalea okinawensis TaxID=2078660 RepID=UPI000CFC8576|nr:DUF1667 domain-containing protein [Vallitalea okinawensis]
MSKTHEMICIVCPLGCRLKVTENVELRVEGNKCKRGKEYALKELTFPTRVLPTTVSIKNGILPRLPVKTNAPIPKDKIFDAMKIINKVEVVAPTKVGDIIIANILDTGVDVVATRDMDEREKV